MTRMTRDIDSITGLTRQEAEIGRLGFQSGDFWPSCSRRSRRWRTHCRSATLIVNYCQVHRNCDHLTYIPVVANHGLLQGDGEGLRVKGGAAAHGHQLARWLNWNSMFTEMQSKYQEGIQNNQLTGQLIELKCNVYSWRSQWTCFHISTYWYINPWHQNVCRLRPTKLGGFVAEAAWLGVLDIALLPWDPTHSIVITASLQIWQFWWERLWRPWWSNLLDMNGSPHSAISSDRHW